MFFAVVFRIEISHVCRAKCTSWKFKSLKKIAKHAPRSPEGEDLRANSKGAKVRRFLLKGVRGQRKEDNLLIVEVRFVIHSNHHIIKLTHHQIGNSHFDNFLYTQIRRAGALNVDKV